MADIADGLTNPVAPDLPFPFSAVVGQEQLKLALILSAIAPSIGGVLIRGEKGTAKTTVVRALGPLLPRRTDSAAAVVELPIGATEDRVIGSLDLQKILSEGAKAFTPGLLAHADGGVLYIDEVNLLADHLVDVLLDAAATGRVVIERDGVSHTQSARFVLVGTMNPEEGELRPQLLDRFGLAVDVTAPREVSQRVAVIERRMAYEADPAEFASEYTVADSEIAAAIEKARAALESVILPTAQLRRIAAICLELDVDGLRGDLVVTRTARAHAAWRGASEVEDIDVRRAVELALPHRRRRDPFDEPGLTEQQIDDALDNADQQAQEPGSSDNNSAPQDSAPSDGGESPADRPDPDPDDPGGGGPPPPGPGFSPDRRGVAVKALRATGVGNGEPGRRSPSLSSRGQAVRGVRDGGHGVHLMDTILAAAAEHIERGQLRLQVLPQDIRKAERRGKEGNLVVFVLDLSGSMTARKRLDAVSGAVVSMLTDSYQRRDRVAVVTLRGAGAEVTVPPTRSVDAALRRLAGVSTGGRTPLAEGLLTARDVVRRNAYKEPNRRPLLVVLTDGRATSGSGALARAGVAADRLRRDGTSTVVVDCEQGMVRLGLARVLAGQLGGECVQLADLTAGGVAAVVRSAA
ncbi:VWA domain-containing protein [Nocardia sp. 348MFTsu5.1]|uniref:VWA domain-containing protein n=1 Tax=Nocardia sp. 348MFTsu5.1 TaxID=1172185 RepID=UPI0003608373|nr:VWA domain-containing protein [Nocardia sp. 348MFTsu5.1]